MERLRVLTLSIGFFLLGDLFAQEKGGIINSNYHPVSTIHYNASSIVDNRTYMQLNLVGLNVWLRSNAVYMKDFNLPRFIASPDVPDLQPIDNKRSKFIYVNAVADGPAFTISKNKWGLGLFARGRTIADMRRIPYQFVNMLFDIGKSEVDHSDEISMRNARLSNMSWVEMGLSAGYMLVERRTEMLSAGINVKRLNGLNLLFLNLDDVQGTYTPYGMNVDHLSGKYRSAAFGWGSGKGWGADLGLTYKKMLSHVDNYRAHSKRSHCKYVDYKYKVGLSLRDAGYISFRNGTVKSELEGSGDLGSDNSTAAGMEATFRSSTTEGEKIRAITPMSLGASLDYNFENDFYLALNFNKNLVPNRATGVQSIDFISVVPRYETRMFEVALPISVQRYLYPQLGFAFRFRSFLVGVDNVVPVVMSKNTSSMGVYFNLALALFKNPACGGSGGKVDDCGHYKNPKRKIKRKNSLMSPRPRKD